jgi:hypothetical protein
MIIIYITTVLVVLLIAKSINLYINLEPKWFDYMMASIMTAFFGYVILGLLIPITSKTEIITDSCSISKSTYRMFADCKDGYAVSDSSVFYNSDIKDIEIIKEIWLNSYNMVTTDNIKIRLNDKE